MNPIGIMQGRLSPPIGGRIQSFPVDTWRDEFSLAREAGLDCIEWIYEVDTEAVNPLRTDEGVAEIRRLAEESGVVIWSVTADYYMTERLIRLDGTLQVIAVEHLKWLLKRVRLIRARYVMVPFVDAARLRSEQEIKGLQTLLQTMVPVLDEMGVQLHMETDLPPDRWAALLESISHPLIRVCYDIGDRASLGYNPTEEFRFLGSCLGSVHIKDRIVGGGTVPLGTGAADFPTCFQLICAAGFRGPFILQAAREEGLSEIELARWNRRFVEEQLAAVTSEGKDGPGTA